MEDNSIKNMREYMVSDGKVDIDGTLFFCGNAILDIAARLDKLTERVGELELASPCPMLKSICEGWEFTVKLDKEEIIERYAGEIHTIRALDSVQLDTVKQLLSDLIDEVTR